MKKQTFEEPDDYEAKLLKQQEEFLKSGSKPSVSTVTRGPPPIVLSKSQAKQREQETTVNTSTPPSSTTPSTSSATSKFKHQKLSNNGIPIIDEPMGERDVVSLSDDLNHLKSKSSNLTSTSRFKLNSQKKQQQQDEPTIEEMDHVQEEEEDVFDEKRDVHITSVITNIYERDVSNTIFEAPKKKNIGFPEAVHRSVLSFSKNKQTNIENTQQQQISIKKAESIETTGIEQENNKKLEGMSEHEIKENQEYLLKHLDPKIVEMLKNRKSKTNNDNKNNIKIEAESNTTTTTNTSTTTTTTTNTSTTSTNQTTATTKTNKTVQFKDVEIENKVELESSIETKPTQSEPEYDETTIWMKDLDKQDERKGFKETILNFREWRFNFTGDIIQRGSSTPTSQGLHHHGSEAGEAGYTLNEIIMLIKSSNHSQKCIALKTLTFILQKVHNGSYGSFNKLQLIDEILKLKIPRLLRISIDSQVPSILISALTCIHALIVPTIKENAYEMIESRSHRAYETISIKPIEMESKKQKNEEEEPEKDDDEKCQLDLIRGLVDMGIINRLVYLMDNEAKSSDTLSMLQDPFFKSFLSRLNLILDIFIHFTRHSNQITEEIFNSGGGGGNTTDLIFNSIKYSLTDLELSLRYLINENSSGGENSSSSENEIGLIKILKNIQIKSIRLLRRVSQSSKHCADIMTASSYDLFTFIKEKFLQCNDNQILMEYIKLFRIWFIYRIEVPSFFSEILPTLNRYVLEFTEILNVEAYHLSITKPFSSVEQQDDNNNNENNNNNEKISANNNPMDKPIKFSDNFQNIITSHIMETVRSIYNLLDIMIPLVSVDQQLNYYDSISHFVEPSFIITQTIGVIYHSFREKESDYNLLASIGLSSSVLHFISTFFASLNKILVLSPNQLDRLSSIPSKLNSRHSFSASGNNIMDLIESNTNMIFTSIFGSTMYSDAKRKILSMIYINEENTSNSSNLIKVPINFNFFFEGEISEWWLSVARYLILCLEINRSIGKLIFYMDQSNFFYHLHSILVSTIDYRKTFFNQDRDLILSNYRSKTYLYFYLIKLMNELRFEEEEFDQTLLKFHHSAAMALVPTFLPNDDILLFDLLASTIFQNDYLESIGNLKPSSVSVVLKLFYQDRFFPSKTLQYSQILYRVDDSDNQLDDLLISFESENSLLPLKYDWFNLPIEFLYQSSIELYNSNSQDYFDENESDWNEDLDSPPLVSNTLLFIQSLYNSNSQYIHSIPLENTYQILMKIFLLKSEPWKNLEISKLLKHLLIVLINNLKNKDNGNNNNGNNNNNENDQMEIDGNQENDKEFDFEGYFGSKFYQFYQEFIQHFVSVSFNSEIFSSFIWVFLRQCYNHRYRILFWNELFPTLHYLNCSDQQLPLGNDGYLLPYELNTELLSLYKNSLIQKKTNRNQASKLYLIAIHHLSHFIFGDNQEDDDEEKQEEKEEKVKRNIFEEIKSNGIKSQYLSSILSDAPRETIIDLLSYHYQKGCIFQFTCEDSSEITDQRKQIIKQFIDLNSHLNLKDKFENHKLF
ncbi:hypothetical protein ACTFIW_002566 [Dictyostelium discoideum]